MKGDKLTEKHRLFVSHYLKEKNATKAAILAGYSEKTAGAAGCRLLKNVKINEKIEEKLQKQEEKILISADRVIEELAKIALTDLAAAYDEYGKLKDLKDMPDNVRHAIAGVETEELFDGVGKDRDKIGFTKKIKLWDKVKALELLGKHFKLYTDKVEHTVDESLAERFMLAEKSLKE